jgi:hypothetical protein
MYSLKSEVNPSDNYRKAAIVLLCNLSTFFRNAKPFNEITREDLLSFLDSHRKIESVDPLHKWIGTYNLYRVHLMRFFKWLYSPDIDYKQRGVYNRAKIGSLDFSACKQSTILFFLHMYSVSIQKQNDKAKFSHHNIKRENGTPT